MDEPLHVQASSKQAIHIATINLVQHGVVQIHDLHVVNSDHAKAAHNTLAKVLSALDSRKLEYREQKETSFTFSDVASRDRGRVDVRYDMDRYAQLIETPLLRLIIASVLGDDYQVAFSGIVYSLADSVAQAWHRDGPHLATSDGPTAPAHALTAFFPLCDVTEDRGSPQFIPGSHLLSDEVANTTDHHVVQFNPLAATDCVVFDYRLLHRGMPNVGSDTRPLMYVVFSVPHWCDDINFGTEPLL
jgi:hypothetical protein